MNGNIKNNKLAHISALGAACPRHLSLMIPHIKLQQWRLKTFLHAIRPLKHFIGTSLSWDYIVCIVSIERRTKSHTELRSKTRLTLHTILPLQYVRIQRDKEAFNIRIIIYLISYIVIKEHFMSFFQSQHRQSPVHNYWDTLHSL